MIDEGYIESIELADQSLPVSLGGAFPHMLGQPLNLRDLEQGLDQLNRLRSIDLTADIAPGSQPGASRIILRSRTAGQSRWALGLGIDNLGSASTGRDRNSVSLSVDSPLQLNDLLSLSASDTLNQGIATTATPACITRFPTATGPTVCLPATPNTARRSNCPA